MSENMDQAMIAGLQEDAELDRAEVAAWDETQPRNEGWREGYAEGWAAAVNDLANRLHRYEKRTRHGDSCPQSIKAMRGLIAQAREAGTATGDVE